MELLRDRERVARIWVAVIGGFFAVQGAWAFVSPRGFYDALAVFEPFNHHFIRDIGSIQVGVGVAGLVAARRATGLVVGLTGLATFQVLHVLSHVVDRDDGGRPAFDITALGLAAVITVVALWFAARPGPRRSPPTPTAPVGGQRQPTGAGQVAGAGLAPCRRTGSRSRRVGTRRAGRSCSTTGRVATRAPQAPALGARRPPPRCELRPPRPRGVMYDVLATLRRSGEPFELTAGELLALDDRP